MEEFWYQLTRSGPPTLRQLFDLLVVSYLIYRLLLLIRGSRAWRIIGGITIFLAVWFASDLLELRTLHWVLDKALVMAPIALVLLLLPELRSALEDFGRLGFWPGRLGGGEETMDRASAEEIVGAVAELANLKTGCIIVIERSRKLNDVARTGVPINAKVTAALLGSIFHGSGPLHDGAVLIRGSRLIAAACRLPLSDSQMRTSLHMRHRAAVGATENSDAVSIVVSEERGSISLAMDGKLRENISISDLRDFLTDLLRADKRSNNSGREEKKHIDETAPIR